MLVSKYLRNECPIAPCFHDYERLVCVFFVHFSVHQRIASVDTSYKAISSVFATCIYVFARSIFILLVSVSQRYCQSLEIIQEHLQFFDKRNTVE